MKNFYLTNLFYDWMIYVDGLDVIDSRSLEQYYAFFAQHNPTNAGTGDRG